MDDLQQKWSSLRAILSKNPIMLSHAKTDSSLNKILNEEDVRKIFLKERKSKTFPGTICFFGGIKTETEKTVFARTWKARHDALASLHPERAEKFRSAKILSEYVTNTPGEMNLYCCDLDGDTHRYVVWIDTTNKVFICLQDWLDRSATPGE